eukprot:TRINITY_DN3116_c1_g1_i2.p1 TRINITY_DN3116_c1_g1~~TRINITY_DN3116_c1_g1_i2.p1  ORF type:complete len:359 (-),score=65.34 TRINITY_DN3116_c1_g1_i2:252-1328(-)
MYPVPPPVQEVKGGGIPWWIWFLGGFAFATLIQKLSDFVKQGPAAFMGQNTSQQQAMMDQMMKSMMQAQQSQAPPSPPPPFTVDTTAKTVTSSPSSPTTPPTPTSVPGTATLQSSTEQAKGERFNQIKQSEATQQYEAQSTAFFSDAAVNGATTPVEPEVVSQGAGGEAAGDNGAGSATAMFEMMLNNKEFRDMFKQYLPKEMQDDETMLSLMKNPMVRKQMEEQIAQQIKNPDMMNKMMGSMKNINMKSAEEQLKSLGTNPQELMTKMMSDKDMQALIMKPNVQKALFAMQSDPSKAFDYMSDPDVQQMMHKLQGMFPGQAGMMAGNQPQPQGQPQVQPQVQSSPQPQQAVQVPPQN